MKRFNRNRFNINRLTEDWTDRWPDEGMIDLDTSGPCFVTVSLSYPESPEVNEGEVRFVPSGATLKDLYNYLDEEGFTDINFTEVEPATMETELSWGAEKWDFPIEEKLWGV